MQVIVLIWQRDAVGGVGDNILGIAAIHFITGEPTMVAKVFAMRAAIAAVAAAVIQPRHTNPLADTQASHYPATMYDRTGDLVPQYKGQLV